MLPRIDGRVLLIGASGQLGSALVRRLVSCTWDAATREAFDLARPETIRQWFAAHAPYDVVLNAAAFTAVDACETEVSTALAVNGVGPQVLADEVARQGGTLVHVSTDYVFPGTKETPYVEDDPVAPVNVYGRTKWAGEAAVRCRCPRHFIVRTSWLFGLTGKNFVKSILHQALTRGEIRVVCDQFGCPTCAPDLAEAILRLISTQQYGTYHAANAGVCSWFDFASAAVEIAGIPCRKILISTADFRREHPHTALRPMHSALDCTKITQVTGQPMRPWQAALEDFISEWKKGHDGIARS